MVSESKFDIQDCLGFVKLTTRGAVIRYNGIEYMVIRYMFFS